VYKKATLLLIVALGINLSVLFTALGDTGIYSIKTHLIWELLYIIPILLGAFSLVFKKHFSLYPTYLFALAHFCAIHLWLVLIVLSFGLALLIPALTYGMAWFSYPWALTLLVVQGFVWTFIAPPVLVSELTGESFSLTRNLLKPANKLPLKKRIIFYICTIAYTVIALFYYLFVFYDYGVVPLIGPPS
jgi:hypothetical protein